MAFRSILRRFMILILLAACLVFPLGGNAQEYPNVSGGGSNSGKTDDETQKQEENSLPGQKMNENSSGDAQKEPEKNVSRDREKNLGDIYSTPLENVPGYSQENLQKTKVFMKIFLEALGEFFDLLAKLLGDDISNAISGSNPDSSKEKAKGDVSPGEKEETGAAKPPTETYTVASGDTLWDIATRFLGSGNQFMEIVEANKDKYPSLLSNPGLIHPGWVLTIPSGSSGAVSSAPPPVEVAQSGGSQGGGGYQPDQGNTPSKVPEKQPQKKVEEKTGKKGDSDKDKFEQIGQNTELFPQKKKSFFGYPLAPVNPFSGVPTIQDLRNFGQNVCQENSSGNGKAPSSTPTSQAPKKPWSGSGNYVPDGPQDTHGTQK